MVELAVTTGLSPVAQWGVRVRISLRVLYAPVDQLAESIDLNPIQCGFESRSAYDMRI